MNALQEVFSNYLLNYMYFDTWIEIKTKEAELVFILTRLIM